MSKLKNGVKLVIFLYGVCLLIGCQINNKPDGFYWYKPGNSIRQCEEQWTCIGMCDYKDDCMYEKGYKLLKREELPNGVDIKEIKVQTHHAINPYDIKHGVAGLDNATWWNIYKEQNLNIRKEYVEGHPYLSDSVKRGIINGTVVKGMTVDEAKLAKNNDGTYQWKFVISDSSDNIMYDYGPYRYIFLDGKLVDWLLVGF